MKKLNLIILFGLAGALGFGMVSAHTETSQVRADSADQEFFSQTGENIDYSQLNSVIDFQGQNGVRLYSGNSSTKKYLNKLDSRWVAGEAANSAFVKAGSLNPGKDGVVIEWTAPKTGTYLVKGMLYNHYAFSTTETLATGLTAREAGTSSTRDGVTIGASFSSSFNSNYNGSYNTKTLTSDFALFVNKGYFAVEGDKLQITINGNNDYSQDELSFYFGIEYSKKVLEYDFTGDVNPVVDKMGTSNRLAPKLNSVVVTDPDKGVHMNAGQATDSTPFFYDYNNFTNTDFTDYLKESTIHVRFTIEGESNDWNYIFSTTSHELGYEKKGIALGLNTMGQRTTSNKLKYSLQLRVEQEGNPGFWDCTAGWINDLYDGGTYDAYINLSEREKKVEVILTGDYNDGWMGTNASNGTAGAMKTEAYWTMNNPGAHGLVVGAYNEAGENGFHGWIKTFEVFDNNKTYTTNTTTGPFRDSGLTEISVTGVNALSPIAYNPVASELVASAPTQVTLNLSNQTTVQDTVTWDAQPVITAGECYLVGRTNTVKYAGEAVIVKQPINGLVVTVVDGGEYSVSIKDSGANNDLPTSGTGYTMKYYTDSACTSEFNAATFTESVKVYAKKTYTTYTISYVLDGGTNASSNPSTYQVIDSLMTLADPTKDGYIFEGWYKEATFATKVTSIDPSEVANITLYAKWRAIAVYTITYNLNGGVNAETNPASLRADKDAVTLADATREGYTFLGWYADEAFTQKVFAIDPADLSGDITLYAKWEKLPREGCIGSIGGSIAICTLSALVGLSLIKGKKEEN